MKNVIALIYNGQENTGYVVEENKKIILQYKNGKKKKVTSFDKISNVLAKNEFIGKIEPFDLEKYPDWMLN